MKITTTFTVRTVLSNFGPWIVYGLVSAAGYQGWACVCGLIILPCQLAFRRKVSLPKIMDGISLLFFLGGAFSILALHSSLFPRSGSALLWSALCVPAWGSLLVNSPFTADYARESVSENLWISSGFRRVNIIVTVVWGTIFVLNALAATILMLHHHWKSELARTWLNVLPYVSTIFGIMFTNRFPQWASQQRAKNNPLGPDITS